VSEKVEEAPARKRRRRRRRKRAAVFQPVAFSSPENPAVVTPQQVVAEADEDAAPIGPSKVKALSVNVELPIRYMEILEWAAGANRRSVEEQIAVILRGVLSGLKPQWREAVYGTAGASATKGQMQDRLLERKRPST
jgi:hypothetical protein